MSTKKRILFVCLGNICRSPIAEAVFSHLVNKNGLSDDWEVDSAATAGWHTGSRPDKRALDTLKKHNVPYDNRARTVRKNDFIEYDYIVGMDTNNIDDLKRMVNGVTNPKAKIMLMGEMCSAGDGEVMIIRDPYYDDDSKGFEKCYQQCLKCCTEFLKL